MRSRVKAISWAATITTLSSVFLHCAGSQGSNGRRLSISSPKKINTNRALPQSAGQTSSRVAAPCKGAGKLHQVHTPIAKGIEPRRCLIQRESAGPPQRLKPADSSAPLGGGASWSSAAAGGDQNIRGGLPCARSPRSRTRLPEPRTSRSESASSSSKVERATVDARRSLRFGQRTAGYRR